MVVGLNVASLNWGNSFSNLPHLVRSVGAGGVEFPVQLWQARRGIKPEELRRVPVLSLSGLLHKTEVVPESILANVQVWAAQQDGLEAKCVVAAELGRPSLAMCIDAWSAIPYADSLPLFMERVRECARAAARFGLEVHLEFIAPAVARANGDRREHPFCTSLTHAIHLIKGLGTDSIRLLLDIIHWYADGRHVDPGSIRPLIGSVHIADHVGKTPTDLTDSGRVLPFTGGLPLDDFLASLKLVGYDRPIIIETFPGPAGHPVGDLARAIERLQPLT